MCRERARREKAITLPTRKEGKRVLWGKESVYRFLVTKISVSVTTTKYLDTCLAKNDRFLLPLYRSRAETHHITLC